VRHVCNLLELGVHAFLELTGYIDESLSGDQRLFTLSAIVAERLDWRQFEVEWGNCFEKINSQLKVDCRRPISRYHASDCSSRSGEFSGWTNAEQVNLTKQLLEIFQQHNTKTFSYTIDLDALARAFPQWKTDRPKGGYDFLTAFIVREIGEWLGKLNNSDAKIKLIHDRCQYSQTIKDSFQDLLRHPNFEHKRFFETIEPSSWETCGLLQAADLLAYESMKEAERKISLRKRRKTLELFLDLASFGVVAKYIGPDEVVGISNAIKRHKL